MTLHCCLLHSEQKLQAAAHYFTALFHLQVDTTGVERIEISNNFNSRTQQRVSMHQSSLYRMQWFINNYIDPNICYKILDVGSFDVNGSYKPLFASTRAEYTGLDMEAGPNVDIAVSNPYCWAEIEDKSYDVVISGQAFEHIEFFWVTIEEMIRVLRPGGLLCIIAPRLQTYHRYPVDCYRFDTDGMVAIARYGNLTPIHASTNMAPPEAPLSWYNTNGDAMLVARKPEDWCGLLNIREYSFEPADVDALATGFLPKKKHPKYTPLVKLKEKLKKLKI
jgi:SAM-dependent methyltransferase